ncbi:MAG: 16S rRNA (adenine(1518)-N(6)/adenine(1519)-N(6))-dimethyltransferase RsmA [Saprospiraceae bacterium]
MRAKKSFGQHFLINEPLSEQIAYSLRREAGYKNVLEIGPGKGVLTKYLLKQDINLRVVEADKDMVSYLEGNYPKLKDNIIFLDFLKLNMKKVFDGEPFYLIGNYPYNISSQILFKMVKHRALIPEMIGMFQKEVSDRVISPPGNKTYGVVSVLIQAFYTGETVVKVSPGSFNPPPKVNSSVIRLTRRENYELGCDYSYFRQVVKIAFSQRRKMMRNTLKGLVTDTSILKEDIFTKRPEQLGVEEFVALTLKIADSNGHKMQGS